MALQFMIHGYTEVRLPDGTLYVTDDQGLLDDQALVGASTEHLDQLEAHGFSEPTSQGTPRAPQGFDVPPLVPDVQEQA